ncbi:MAG: hypothetical protein RL318_1084 [Fibrobacterota bacterium]|jgi:hypothetical protein
MKLPLSRGQWAAIALSIFLVELLIATVWAKVPFVREDLGDFLVVILLYCIAKAVRDFAPLPLAASVLAFSFCVEFAQYFHIADRMGFARGSIPSIVIGTTYQTTDLLMYLAGCLTAWLVDSQIVRRGRRRGSDLAA